MYPDIFVLSNFLWLNSGLFPGSIEHQVKLEDTIKQSYENLAPPPYSLERNHIGESSYELPPGYPCHIWKQIDRFYNIYCQNLMGGNSD